AMSLPGAQAVGRLKKKPTGHRPAGATEPSAAPGGAVRVITQPPPEPIDSRHRPARSTGGGCGGGGAGGCGGGEVSAWSPEGAAKRDVLVHALLAARVRIRRAAVAPCAPGRLHLDMVMHKAAENSDWNRSKRQLREWRKSVAGPR